MTASISAALPPASTDSPAPSAEGAGFQIRSSGPPFTSVLDNHVARTAVAEGQNKSAGGSGSHHTGRGRHAHKATAATSAPPARPPPPLRPTPPRRALLPPSRQPPREDRFRPRADVTAGAGRRRPPRPLPSPRLDRRSADRGRDFVGAALRHRRTSPATAAPRPRPRRIGRERKRGAAADSRLRAATRRPLRPHRRPRRGDEPRGTAAPPRPRPDSHDASTASTAGHRIARNHDAKPTPAAAQQSGAERHDGHRDDHLHRAGIEPGRDPGRRHRSADRRCCTGAVAGRGAEPPELDGRRPRAGNLERRSDRPERHGRARYCAGAADPGRAGSAGHGSAHPLRRHARGRSRAGPRHRRHGREPGRHDREDRALAAVARHDHASSFSTPTTASPPRCWPITPPPPTRCHRAATTSAGRSSPPA